MKKITLVLAVVVLAFLVAPFQSFAADVQQTPVAEKPIVAQNPPKDAVPASVPEPALDPKSLLRKYEGRYKNPLASGPIWLTLKSVNGEGEIVGEIWIQSAPQFPPAPYHNRDMPIVAKLRGNSFSFVVGYANALLTIQGDGTLVGVIFGQAKSEVVLTPK